MKRHDGSTVLTIRLDRKLKRSLAREAERRRTTKSELARQLLAEGLDPDGPHDLEREARRQSMLVSERDSEREALDFLEHAADPRGWE